MRKSNLLLAGILLALTVITGVSECYAINKPTPQAEVPKDKFDLKGLFFGMSKKNLRGLNFDCHKIPEPNCTGDSFCGSRSITLAGKKIKHAILILKKEKVTGMQFTFDSSDSSDIADAFTRKHGKPLFTQKNKLQNAFGRSVVQVERTWRIKDAKVVIRNVADNITEGTLVVEQTQFDASIVACLTREKAADQNDL